MLRQSLSILKQFGSAAKSHDATELLHEDLVVVEQRVEPAKKAAQVLHKKLQGCMHSQAGLEAEKRMKKLPLMLLSVSMAESLKDFDAESSIRRVLEMCCFMEKMLASMLANFEMKVEKEVLEPLNKLSEDDLPEILKNKKQFAKLTTDWNNARTRSQASTGPQAKQDGLREEVEEAWRRLGSIKDEYSADLYLFATKEDDYANYFIRFLELQAEYHKYSHEFLNKNISELKASHSRQAPPPLGLSGQRVYGEPLLAHLAQSNRDIAAPIQECVHMLLRTGMTEEGLFRLAAAASVVKRLKTCLDHEAVDHGEFSMDPHAVAGALKGYLRELPEPLMTFELYNDWFIAAGVKDPTEKLDMYRALLRKLPPDNYNNLRYLVQFLSLLSEQQAVNKMTPGNIAIVLGPNLLWPRAEGEAALFDMAAASSVQVVTVIEPLIQFSCSLFPEAVSFEIPELPEVLEVSPPAAASPPPSSEKENVRRTVSSSSSTASSSSHHLPLSKTNSAASQDGGGGFFLVKSGSVGRGGGTSTWSSPPVADAVAPTCQSPTLLPKAAAANPSPPETACSDPGQLESILEAPPDSPRAFVTISSPYKPKRSFHLTKATRAHQANEQVTVQYCSPRPPVPQKLQAPPPMAPPPMAPPPMAPPPAPAPTDPAPRAQWAGVKRPPPKKPGRKAPNCPPPLPPPSRGKVVPSLAQ